MSLEFKVMVPPLNIYVPSLEHIPDSLSRIAFRAVRNL